MIPFRLDMTRVALEAWGRPENIGAETLEGPIALSRRLLFASLDAPVLGGLYASTRGKYRAEYSFDEHATLLDGDLALTDVKSGEPVPFGTGHS